MVNKHRRGEVDSRDQGLILHLSIIFVLCIVCDLDSKSYNKFIDLKAWILRYSS